MSLQIAFACAVALCSGASSPHLRVTNERILDALQFATPRSATFRALIAAIETSDRIVYVEEGACGRDNAVSCVVPVPHTAYLRVRVRSRDSLLSVVRQLAHEFEHVIEIAADPHANEAGVIQDLYERIGFRSCALSGCYETRAALDVESRVSREVSSGRPAPSAAPLETLTDRGRSR